MDLLRQRWLRLAYGAIIMISVGFIYGWSIFSEPFKNEFGWDAPTLSLTFSILMVFFCLGGIVGARVMARTSARTVLIAAAVSACIGFLGALLVTAETPWVLHLTYGVFAGLTSGIAYNAVLGSVVTLFPDRTGLVSGLLLMCYGCATMVLGSAAAVMFAAVGWRQTFVILAVFITIVLVLGSFVESKPSQARLDALTAALHQREQERTAAPTSSELKYGELDYDEVEYTGREHIGRESAELRHPHALVFAEAVPDVGETIAPLLKAALEADEIEDAIEAVAQTHRPAGASVTTTPPKPVPISRLASVHDYSTSQMLRNPNFYVYGAWMLILGSAALAFTGYANQIALTFGLSPALGIVFVSLMSIANASGRFLWGFILDIAPPTLVMFLIALLHSLGAVLLILAFVVASPLLLGCGFVLFSLGMSGNPVMGSGFMAKFFGPSHYAANLSVLNAINIPNALIGPSIASFVLMATASFVPTFSVFIVAGLLAIACVGILQYMTVLARRKRLPQEASS